ncbi:MAG: TetR/AcrR family transcriptional regulator [Actinomycetota bacterium]|jgi:AcrR family transcriptional regulator|nr:TetR/AcrR family transcriptional regulator [Actinomycetota bacterium]
MAEREGPVIARSDTSLNILDSAKSLFATKGYEGTSTREIAEDAGLTVGAIYKYYPSKAALLEEITTEAATVLEPLLQGELDEGKDDVLYRLTRRLVIFNLEYTRESKIANEEYRSLPEPALTTAINARRRIRRIFEQAIVDTVGAGEAIDRALVTVLSAIIVGMAATPRDWWHPNQQFSLEQTAHIYASVAVQCVNLRELTPESLAAPLRGSGLPD